MSPGPINISDAELDVLKALWAMESATVRDLQEHLHAQGRDWAYTTVQTLVQRLIDKGCVRADKSGRAHLFRPRLTQEQVLGVQLGDLADRICDGASTPLMLSLLKRGNLSADDLAHLRQVLDEMVKDDDAGKSG